MPSSDRSCVSDRSTAIDVTVSGLELPGFRLGRVFGQHAPLDNEETLSPGDLLLETLMMGFRTYRGVDTREIERRFDVDLFAHNAELIERLHTNGLIRRNETRLIPTLDGLAVADSLSAMFRLGTDLFVNSRNRA